ncbi:nuclear export factor GLE1 [beta proteobacterium AAP99]|nr:nuclear export factor GLE1 [beta proteobacterium AAP99]
MKHPLSLLALALFAAQAHAHIVLEQRTAEAGSYYKATFMLTHGCDGSPTREIKVTLPEGFQRARPQPKPGWTVETQTEKLAKPYETHGKTITEDVRSVTWRGGLLSDAHFDELIIMGRLPATPGKIYFKVEQVCEKGRHDWVAIPEPGKTLRDYKEPAAELTLTPRAEPAAARAHKHE